MTVVTEEPSALAPALDEQDETRLRRTVLAGTAAFVAILVGFWAWWPIGVVLGLVGGGFVVFRIGRAMQVAMFDDSVDGLGALEDEEELRAEFRRLRVRLGDDWALFRRAALLVTEAQWASVAGLQRELGISTGAAQHILGQLEREGFVGPSRGNRARVVRLARDRAAELDRLMRL
ncbi:DNA translocase FtsK [Amnibacterium setariae]|nr:DNA translocase FtsK [Amnibacterium setariae]